MSRTYIKIFCTSKLVGLQVQSYKVGDDAIFTSYPDVLFTTRTYDICVYSWLAMSSPYLLLGNLSLSLCVCRWTGMKANAMQPYQ